MNEVIENDEVQTIVLDLLGTSLAALKKWNSGDEINEEDLDHLLNEQKTSLDGANYFLVSDAHGLNLYNYHYLLMSITIALSIRNFITIGISLTESTDYAA